MDGNRLLHEGVGAPPSSKTSVSRGPGPFPEPARQGSSHVEPDYSNETTTENFVPFESDLEDVLAFLTREYMPIAADHLFATDNSIELATLTNPSALSNAMTVTMAETPVQRPTYSLAMSRLSVLSHHILRRGERPFAVGLGSEVGLNEGSASLKALAGRKSLGRFIVDHYTGERIVVSRALNKNDSIATMFFVQHSLTTGGVQVFCVCDREQLELGVRAQNAAILRNAIGLCYVRQMARKCVVCGSPPAMLCGCTIPTEIPTHPLDFSRVPRARHFCGTQVGPVYGSFNRSSVSNVVRIMLLGAGGNPPEVAGVADKIALWQNFVSQTLSFSADRAHRNYMVQVGLSSLGILNVHPPLPLTAACDAGNDSSANTPDSEAGECKIFGLGPTQGALEGDTSRGQAPSNVAVETRGLVQLLGLALGPAAAPAPKLPNAFSGAAVDRLRQRRERNRLAAARSNARRKANDSARKRDLAEAKARVSDLARRESALLEENRRLYQALLDRKRVEPVDAG